MHYISILRNNPEFAKLWIAQVISLTGDWFATIALLGLVTRYSDGSGIAISIFLVLRVLPPLLVAPFGGVLLDRYNRKHLLVASNILRAIIIPFFLLAQSSADLWIIYLITTIQFTLSAIFEPGQAAIIPALVQPDDIIEANTLMSVTWSVMLAVGAIVGGVFAYLFGIFAALLADALTFLVAGLLIQWITYDRDAARKRKLKQDEPTEDTSLREGLRYLRQSPIAQSNIFIKFGQSIGNVDTLMTIIATEIFVLGADGELSLAIFWSFFGIGAIVGPIIANRFQDGSPDALRRMVGIAYVSILIGWLVLGFSYRWSFIAVCTAILFRSMGGSINWTYSNILIQKTTPDEKLGRMFSMDMVGYYLATVVSILIHGWLIDTFGIDNLQWVILGTFAVAIIPYLIWMRWLPTLNRLTEQQITPAAVAGD